jgi:shikimate kinase / 3-dehydroquinate synthase
MSDPRLEKSSGGEPALVAALGARSIVLVGMMGAGKSSVGRRLAARLAIPFVDADAQIEEAAQRSIPEIFETYGETEFRSAEARVIARLLESGPQVLATGGGAFMNPDTRAVIRAKGISFWLKADVEVLLRRVKRRSDRPLLKAGDPAETLLSLMAERDPVYAEADATIHSREVPHERIVDEIVACLSGLVDRRGRQAGSPGDHVMTAPFRAPEPTIVRVELGERAYDIAIGRGLLASAGKRIAALRPGAAAIIVTDETVARHHVDSAEASLAAAKVRTARLVLAPGEASKSWRVLETVCDAILAARIERRDLVVALGGGVIGDLAGFAAAITRRGLDVVQIPTTLLAQVDSSVGGKTGINSVHGKNLVGAFHQPVLVVADTALLDTLSPREFRAGYAEVAKYGLINDAAFFAWLETNWRDLFAGGPAREHAVAISCRAKAGIVGRDERETGERMLLNLGHTFGHAFEAAAGFSDRLLHGEAVALGMALAFAFSQRLGLLGPSDVERVTAHLATVGLPTHPREVPGPKPGVDQLMTLIAQDKKVKRGGLTFILARGVGESFVAPEVDANEVRAFLAEKLA